MPTNKISEDKFDEKLGRALRSYSEPVPADFTERTLRQIRHAEEQKILARVVMQERLALAGCILAGIAAVIAVVFFPGAVAAVFRSIAGSFTERGGALVDGIPQSIETVRGQWQFYSILAILSGFGLYSLVGLFTGDKLRMA